MNLNSLSNQELHTRTLDLAQEERSLTTEILRHLREIERRRYFAELGYSSLHDYCTHELYYSDAAAHRRISSMRLLREIPEIEASVESGKITLSNLSTLQSFFQAEKRTLGKTYSANEKLELAQSLEGKSRRECEKDLAEISPTSIPRERERVVGSGETQISFVAPDSLMRKLKQIQDLGSRGTQGPGSRYAELFEWMAERVLKSLDPAAGPKRAQKVGPNASAAESHESDSRDSELGAPELKAHPPADVAKWRFQRRTPRAEVLRFVWRRDRGRCRYRSAHTGRECGATYGLQIDHIYAYALGGSSDDPKNLRLVCKQHNRLHAVRTFGESVMKRYLRTG